MSVDLLRSRLHEDIQRERDSLASQLVSQTQAPLDQIRLNQGIITGLTMAADLLDERFKNLHAIG